MKQANLAVRFQVELCALAALAYSGFGLDAPILVRVVLGVATPLIAAIAWGAYVAFTRETFSPGIDEARACGARRGSPRDRRHRAGLAGAFAAPVVVNTALTTIWRHRWYA